MTFSELWAATVKKQPELANQTTPIQMTVAAFKQAVESAYHKGREHEIDKARRVQSPFPYPFHK